METTQNRSTAWLWLALAALCFTVAFLAVSRPSPHAVARHGANAHSVTRRMADADPNDDDTWSEVCPDGKRYTIRQLDTDTWDVSIDTPDLAGNVTRSTTHNAEWIARKLTWCKTEER